MTHKALGILLAILIGSVSIYWFTSDPSPEKATTASTDTIPSTSNERSDLHHSEQDLNSQEVESSGLTQQAGETGEADLTRYQPIEDELIVDTSNTLNEYIRNENGLPIKVIDDDEASFSYRKPLKIIQYSDGKITGLTSYQYFEHETVITSLAVAYDSDGAIEDYQESVESRIVKK